MSIVLPSMLRTLLLLIHVTTPIVMWQKPEESLLLISLSAVLLILHPFTPTQIRRLLIIITPSYNSPNTYHLLSNKFHFPLIGVCIDHSLGPPSPSLTFSAVSELIKPQASSLLHGCAYFDHQSPQHILAHLLSYQPYSNCASAFILILYISSYSLVIFLNSICALDLYDK